MTTKLTLPEGLPYEGLLAAFDAHAAGLRMDAVDRLTRHDYHPRTGRVPISLAAGVATAACAAAVLTAVHPSAAGRASRVTSSPAASAIPSVARPTPDLSQDRIRADGYDHTFVVPASLRAAINACDEKTHTDDGIEGNCLVLTFMAGSDASPPPDATTISVGGHPGWSRTTSAQVTVAVQVPSTSGADKSVVATARVVDGAPTAADLIEFLASGLSS